MATYFYLASAVGGFCCRWLWFIGVGGCQWLWLLVAVVVFASDGCFQLSEVRNNYNEATEFFLMWSTELVGLYRLCRWKNIKNQLFFIAVVFCGSFVLESEKSEVILCAWLIEYRKQVLQIACINSCCNMNRALKGVLLLSVIGCIGFAVGG